jgi:protease-4
MKRVGEGRRMKPNVVQLNARGRVWTGSAAQNRGLVDELGGLTDATKALQKKVGVRDVVYYPQKEVDAFSNFLELLDEELETENTKVTAQIPEELVVYYQKYTKIKKMKGLQMRLPFVLSIY